jgi:hypothetical protein
MKNYEIEVTDLFCGELNYGYVNRHTVTAKSIVGAIGKIARQYGLNFKKYYGDRYDAVYHSTTKLTGIYITEKEEE